MTVHPIVAADILEAAAAMWDPIESETSINDSFDVANERTRAALLERKVVLETLKDLDLNEELFRLQRIHEQAKSHAAEAAQPDEQKQQRRASFDSSQPAATVFKGIEWANAFTASRGLVPPTSGDLQDSRNLIPTRRALGFSLRKFVCGTVPTACEQSLRRLVLRLSRGNAIVRFHSLAEPLLDPDTHKRELKSVFFVVFLGEHIEKRIKQLCKIAHANLYDLPLVSELEAAAEEQVRQTQERDLELQREQSGEMKEQTPGSVGGAPVAASLSRDEVIAAELALLDREVADKRDVSETTARNLHKLLADLLVRPEREASDGSVSSPLLDWMTAIRHEQTFCILMQAAHCSRDLVIVEGWCPSDDLPRLQEAVRNAVTGTGNPPAMLEINPSHPLRPHTDTLGAVPPTAFPLNKFTEAVSSKYAPPQAECCGPAAVRASAHGFAFDWLSFLMSAVPRPYLDLRCTSLRRSESGALHHHNLSVPLRRHVRGQLTTHTAQGSMLHCAL